MHDLDFLFELKDIRATNLTTRNRFKDKIRIVGEVMSTKFKSEKILIGGGDLEFRFSYRCMLQVSEHALEENKLKLKCMRSRDELYGQVIIDLYTLATGPVEHSLPILDYDQKVVGRLNFSLVFEQVSNVAVLFKWIKLSNLKPAPGHSECNPYLKYGYSRNWLAIQDGKCKACYSPTDYSTRNPSWTENLPELRFTATLKEILSESIVLHVTHKGKIHNTTIARCNLLFRTLVESGKSFKDEDLISFKGGLKVENAEIEGNLIFKFLPKYAQMKPINAAKKSIHTEKGIFDSAPLISILPVPKIPVIITDDKKISLDTNNRPVDSPNTRRKRAATLSGANKKELAQIFSPTRSTEEENGANSDSDNASMGSSDSANNSPRPDDKKDSKTGKKPQEDLISFSPVNQRVKAFHSQSMMTMRPVSDLTSQFDAFDPFADAAAISTSTASTTTNLLPSHIGPKSLSQPSFFPPHAFPAMVNVQQKPNPFASEPMKPANPFVTPEPMPATANPFLM